MPLARLLVIAAIGAGALAASRQPVIVHTLEARVPVAPAVVAIDGRPHLVEEVHVTNLRREPLQIDRLTVRREDGAAIVELSGAALAAALIQPGVPREVIVPPVLAPGRRAVIYVWVPVAGALPPRIVHELDVTAVGVAPLLQARVTLGAGSLAVTPAIEIDPPLAGGPWVAVYDPLLMGGHRTTLIALDGMARIPARFAIDWIRAPDLARPAAPNAEPLRNGFGCEVLAVADATVVRVRDGSADLPAGVSRTPQPLALDEGSGNYVVLDIGGGRFAIYEHLQQGSVRVRGGDTVRRGQVIGALGSSGSTSIGPHLHFHIADAGSTLTAEGMPFVLRTFDVLGGYASLDALSRGEAWTPRAGAEGRRQREHPPAVSVVEFPRLAR